MVCKKDVVTWFKGLKSYKRTDVMCTLLHLCLPFELRFLGTCLENLGKRDFHELRQTENEANSQTELNSPDIQNISNHRARTKLTLYVSLLYSCNYACSNSIFKILTKNEDILSVVKSSVPSEEVLEDLLLIYTLALNHPAFSYEQKTTLEKYFIKLQEEERRLSELSASRTKPNFVGSVVQEPHLEKAPPPSLQSYQNCISLEDQQIIGVTSSGQCPPLPPGAPHMQGDHVSLYPADLSGLRMGYSPVAPVMVANHPWPGMVLPSGGPPEAGSSPLVSRTSSPCQSNSPSRPGSPPQPAQGRPPPKQPFVPGPPPPRPHDSLRDAIGKEMPLYVANLQNFNSDQLSRMSDEEFREKGLPQSAIVQLRTILTNKQVVPTNGIGPVMEVKKKIEPSDPEGVGRKFPPMDGMPLYNLAPAGLVYNPGTHCYTCFVAPPRGAEGGSKGPRPQPPPYPLEQLRAFRIDTESSFHGSNSSASDTASDHSPPDTPGPPPPPPPQLGSLVGSNEGLSSVGGLMGGELIDRVEERRGLPQGRQRGVGRTRANPPGIQTLSRGRGPNPVHRRREMVTNMSNGGEERKVFASEGPGTFYSPGSAPQYLTQAHYIRPTYPTAAFPSSFVRHTYPFQPNGEIVYQYPPPPPQAQAFVPPPYSPAPAPTIVAPTKMSCHNCGSQSHHAIDCPESTIEEVTKQGQYRIDYNSSYQKPGEIPNPGADK